MEIGFKDTRIQTLFCRLSLNRFVKGTKALLGFTRFDTTAIMEMDAVNTPETRAFYNRSERSRRGGNPVYAALG